MTYLKLCPTCRRKLVPQRAGLVGAWGCTACEWAFTQAEVEQYIDNRPGGVTHIGLTDRAARVGAIPPKPKP